MPFRTPWTKSETYNPIDVAEDNKIRVTEPADMKSTFSERKFKDHSEDLSFYPSLIYNQSTAIIPPNLAFKK